MARSLYRPATPDTVADYPHIASGTHFAMVARDGKYFQRRWQTGFDGKETNVEELSIDYVIGSGSHARSYLHRSVSGGYIELPLGWYAENGGTWGMSPGFDNTHPQTRRFVSYGCVFCHDAYPKIPKGHDLPGSEPVFSGALPEGIDCQRCHGAGAKHIRLAETAGAKVADIRASIVNPKRLTPALQMDVCMQCHLEPTSTVANSVIRRFDRAPFSFTPGEALANYELVFDTPRTEKFEIVNSSAYRLRKSQCFLKSGGKLTCTTCHDPHGEPRGYVDVCRGCHGTALEKKVAAKEHPAGADCVGCHMPKRQTEDVVHVAMTDHWIHRPGPEEHGAVAAVKMSAYYPPELAGADTGYLAFANGEFGRAPESNGTGWYAAIGQELLNTGKAGEAARAFEKGLRLQPDAVQLLVGFGTALRDAGDTPKAAEVLSRATRLAPASAAAWYQAGGVDYALGRLDGAIEKVRKALGINPDLAGGRSGLAEMLWAAGKMETAEEEARAALRMDPFDASAYDLMGRILAGKGRVDEALFDFEKATRLKPSARHLYDYALELAAVQRMDQAQASVEAALRADPDLAEAHELRGGLLASKRQLAEAAREYAEAVRIKPDFAQAQLDLARALAATGDMPGAIEHLKKAAAGTDPQVAQFAAQALKRLGQ